MGRNKTSPFASLIGQLPEVPEEPSEALPHVLQRKPSQAKRNREWEIKNKVTGYRGIPPELDQVIAELAVMLSVPKGEVVRAFLEYGLAAYERGELPLQPHLRIGKMTLFPGAR